MIGSEGKFWEIAYSQNIGKMIGICYRYTADRPLSEDLAHDAFLKAIDKSASFEGKGYFEAWLRRIVVNHVLQYLRDQKKKKYLDEWIRQESVISLTEDDGPNTNPSAQTEFTEQELLDAIHELPEHHRLVFNLYVIDNFTHAQIGEALGIRAGTSKSHLARARKKIKEILESRSGKKHDRKRMIPFLFLWYKRPVIDQLYNDRFRDFRLLPEKIALRDFGEAPAVHTQESLPGISWNYILPAASVVVVLTTLFIALNRVGPDNIDLHDEKFTEAVVPDDDVDPATQESTEGIRKHETQRANENISPATSSSAATFFSDSVIRENINTQRMKRMDSIGIALLMTSGIMFDTTAQTNHKETEPASRVMQHASNAVQSVQPVVTDGSVKANNISKGDRGTFYASGLLWSGKNHELYLKGKIRVDFARNKFRSEGSCSFLGPVYLLMIDDKPAEHDAAIVLLDTDYRVVRLSNREATEKYGEKGRHGAVEISVVNSNILKQAPLN